MSEAKLEAYFFTAVFVGVLVLVGAILYPFIGEIALAVVLATLATPTYSVVRARVRHDGCAAFLVVCAVALAVLLPATGIFLLLVEEVQEITRYATTLDAGALPEFFAYLNAKARAVLPFLPALDLAALFRGITGNISTLVTGAITSAAMVIFSFFITSIALFYFIKDGSLFVEVFFKLSPLTDAEDRQIIHKLRAVTRSLIQGTLVIACLQGILTGMGFLIFGIPNPILWGSVAAVCALIPNVGTSIVALPAIVYLVLTGDPIAGAGLAAWSMLLVGLIDNVLGPKLIGAHTQIHPLFVLLSVLGGMSVFGVAGFLLGPLTFGLATALFEIYKVKVRELHTSP